MKKILITIPILLFLVTKPAFASFLGVEISPSLIKVRAVNNSSFSQKITLKNTTNKTVSYSISMMQFEPSADGKPVLQSNKDSSYTKLFSNTKITDQGEPTTKLSLGPKQSKNLILQSDLSGLDEKDYYFALVFASQAGNNPDSTLVFVKQSFAVNILLGFGKTEFKGQITNFSTAKTLIGDPAEFNIKVQNQADTYTTASGNILIRNVFEQAVGNVEIPKTDILAHSERKITSNWSKGVMMGPYTATLSFSLSDHGPVLTKQVTFFAVPIKPLILAAVLTALFAYIFAGLRAKRK